MLRERWTRPGLVVSAAVHVGALAATLIAFSSTERFEDQQETVPVEVVTANQFNQIMKGDKSAKEVRPDATASIEHVAALEASQPPPPPPPAAAPPPEPEPPTPPERPAEAAPQPVPTPPIRDVTAEPLAPKPPPRPKPPPPAPPHQAAVKPPPRPKPPEKPKQDLLAKLMQDQPPDPPPQPAPKPVQPRKVVPVVATVEESHFDITDLTKLFTRDAPPQRGSTSHDLSKLASLGSPTANAQKMSPSFWAGLDGLMEDQYRRCWSYLGLNNGSKYIPQVRVVYGADGSLQGQPVLINPPSDPSLQGLADSAVRAVRRCNPMKIPDQYAPYYEEWKGRVLRFDPEEMAG